MKFRDLIKTPIANVIVRHRDDRFLVPMEVRSDIHISIFSEIGIVYYQDLLDMDVEIDKKNDIIYLSGNPMITIYDVRTFWALLTMFGAYKWSLDDPDEKKKKPFHPNAILHRQFFDFTYELVKLPPLNKKGEANE